MPTSTNRTKWPIKGGALSIQPGWFPGHSLAQFYINMGYGTEPKNYSHAMLPVFQITGPTNVEYNGTFCLPQVPLPKDYNPKVGDNATIQVIELAQHGAALYNVSFTLCNTNRGSAMKLTATTVRRHYLCRTRRCTRSQQDQLLQFNQSRREDRIPTPLRDHQLACQPEFQAESLGVAFCATRSRRCELVNMDISLKTNFPAFFVHLCQFYSGCLYGA
jgi:hypothetical protein